MTVFIDKSVNKLAARFSPLSGVTMIFTGKELRWRNVENLKYKTIDLATERDVRNFEKIKTNSKYRPKFHITPPHGLLNDPNGFCYYNHQYHLFYQWFPFDTFHGMKHWMHLTSSDLIHWQEHGAKITPTEGYESHGAYSGAAIVEDDQAYLFYTGNIKLESDRDANQCLALLSSDNSVTKYAGNPVIQSVPEGYTGHVRDPKVLKDGGRYFMLLGAQRKADMKGCIIVYKSFDLTKWEFQGELNIEINAPFQSAYMFECPDLLKVDGQDVLIFSPQGVEPQEFRFHNKFNVVYCLGAVDFDNLSFKVEHWDELDRGFDFYAPQTLANSPDKPTLIAWAGTDEELPSMDYGWIHCLTLPRSLSVKQQRLHQYPEKLFEKVLAVQSESLQLDGEQSIHLDSLSFALNLELEQGGCNFEVALVNENNRSVNLVVNDNHISLFRTNYEHHAEDWCFGSTRELETDYDINTISLICDESIIEIYINDGRDVFTCLFFPQDVEHRLHISSTDNTKLNINLQYLTK